MPPSTSPARSATAQETFRCPRNNRRSSRQFRSHTFENHRLAYRRFVHSLLSYLTKQCGIPHEVRAKLRRIGTESILKKASSSYIGCYALTNVRASAMLQKIA